MKVNPLYFRRDEGWPLHAFLRIGKRVGAVIGIALLFTFPGRFYFNTFPFKIIACSIGLIFDALGLRGDALIVFWLIVLLFLIAVYVLYHALLGMFAGFLANVLFCLYKKVKINEEDNSIDYLDFSKKITKADVRRFFIHGVLLTVLIIAIPSYFLWDWDFSRWLFSFFESFYK